MNGKFSPLRNWTVPIHERHTSGKTSGIREFYGAVCGDVGVDVCACVPACLRACVSASVPVSLRLSECVCLSV